MSKLIEQILDHIPHDVSADTELAALLPGLDSSRPQQVKRAIAKSDLVPIRRGLYLLFKRYQRHNVNLNGLAQNIYGPSYISFESALSYHQLIPEAVYTVTSASSKRAREFSTPLGIFAFTQVPME
jgi:predicted transcriptional regulator of viral defense system